MKNKRRLLKRAGVNPDKFDRSQMGIYLYLMPIAVFMALPILFIFVNAFKPIDELFAYQRLKTLLRFSVFQEQLIYLPHVIF